MCMGTKRALKAGMRDLSSKLYLVNWLAISSSLVRTLSLAILEGQFDKPSSI